MDFDSTSSVYNCNPRELNYSSHSKDRETPYEFFKKRTETSFVKSFNNYLQKRRGLSAGHSKQESTDANTSINNLSLLRRLNEASISPQKKLRSNNEVLSPNKILSPNILNSDSKLNTVKEHEIPREDDNESYLKIPFQNSQAESFKQTQNDSVQEYQSPQKRIKAKFLFHSRMSSGTLEDSFENPQVKLSNNLRDLQNKVTITIASVEGTYNETKQQCQRQISKTERLIKFIEQWDYFQSAQLRDLATDLKSNNLKFSNFTNGINSQSSLDAIRELSLMYEKEMEEKMAEAVNRSKKLVENDRLIFEKRIQDLKQEIENLRYDQKIKSHYSKQKQQLNRSLIEHEEPQESLVSLVLNSETQLVNKEVEEENEKLRKENSNLIAQGKAFENEVNQLKEAHSLQLQSMKQDLASRHNHRDKSKSSVEKENYNLKHQLRVLNEEKDKMLEEMNNLINSKEKMRAQQKGEWESLLKSLNNELRDLKCDNNIMRIENEKMVKKLTESFMKEKQVQELQEKYQENLVKFRAKKEECSSLWKIIREMRDLLTRNIRLSDLLAIFKKYNLEKKAKYRITN